MEHELKEARKKRALKRLTKFENRRASAEHAKKTADLFLHAGHGISSHHWNEVSANLSEGAKYNASGVEGTGSTSTKTVNNIIAQREEQREARKTRVGELSKQLKEGFLKGTISHSPNSCRNEPQVAADNSVATAVHSIPEGDESDNEENGKSIGTLSVVM